MGFFDKLFASSAVAKPVIDNEQEAFITTITAAASSDGVLDVEEWNTIVDTLLEKRIFVNVI